MRYRYTRRRRRGKSPTHIRMMQEAECADSVAPAPAVAMPTPAETEAYTREALQEAAQRKHFPAARALAAFLRDPAQTQQITGKGDERTNIIDQGELVTYSLEDDAVSNLFTHLEAVRREGLTSHFSERQGTVKVPTTGIMLDFDLIVNSADARLQDRHAHRIACQVIRAIRHDLIFPARERSASCEATTHVFTIVKPAPVATGEGDDNSKTSFKYGFHMLIPGVRVTRGYKKYLLNTLRDDTGIHSALTDLGVVGEPRDCLDMNSASVPVLFLGSCKRGGSPYYLGPVFEITFDAAFEGMKAAADFYPMVRTFQGADLEKDYNMVAEMALSFEARYTNAEPLVKTMECEPRAELAPQIEELGRRTGGVAEGELLLAEHSLSTLAVHDPEARYLHQVLDILDESYYTDRNKWRDVIYALASTSENYKPLAEWFSHKYYKWANGSTKRLDNFDDLWNDAVARQAAVANPLTKRSIMRWAQMSNPERFRQISEQSYFSILVKHVYDYGGILEHFHVAEVLHMMLGNKFVVDIDSGHKGTHTYCWFEFVVPGQTSTPGEVWKWRKEVEPDELQNYISRNLVKVFEQVALHIEEKRAEADVEEQCKYYQKLGTAFMQSRRKIFNDTFKNATVRQANYLFRRRGFVESLDRNPDLLGIGNGVLHLGAKCKVIDYFHEYPISKFTPVVYRGFDPTNPCTKMMLDAVADMIPEEDFRNWFLFFAASSLAGGVKEGIMLLWWGGGANGKTFIMRMIAKALGKMYATKLDIGLLTADRSKPDGPNSAAMQLKDRRYGYFEETLKSEPLNTQRLKEFVNPGEISASEKFKVQESFEMTANIVVGQNFDFIIDTTDHGTWRRLRHYRSKVRFTSNPDPANPFEKKDDSRFARQYVSDPECQAAFLSILVHYYERLQSEYGGELKRVPCPTLDSETEAFRNSQDTINRFITESVVSSPGNGYMYPLAEVAGRYTEWYNTNINRHHHVASEIIQDLENSALQRYMKLAPNKTRVLTECRILTADKRTLAPNEAFLGVKDDVTPGEENAYARVREGWWNASSTPQVPGVILHDEVDDFLLAESTLPAKKEATLAEEFIQDAEIDSIVAQAYAPRPAFNCTIDDVFDDDDDI